MSRRDVPTHEMGPHDPIDAGFERLLAGGAAEQGTHLALLVTALRSDVRVPAAEDAHVAAMIEAARTSASAHSALRIAPPPSRRTNRSRILLKVLAPAFAALLLFSGMAVAHVLPTPLQDAVDHWMGTSGGADVMPLDDPTPNGDAGTTGSVGADPHSSAGGDAHRRDEGRRPEDRGDGGAKNEDHGQPADHPGQGGAHQGGNNAVDPDDQGQNPSAADRGQGDEHRDDHAVDPDDQGQDPAAADRGQEDERRGGDRH